MKRTMSAHEKDKMMIFDGFREPKGHMIGVAQTVGWFGLNRGQLEFIGAFFFPRKICVLLFVRGTTSFYNKKLQILPVGEGAMWNLPMW